MTDHAEHKAYGRNHTDHRPTLVLVVLLLALAVTGQWREKVVASRSVQTNMFLSSTVDNELYISPEQTTVEGVAPATGLEPFFFHPVAVNDASSQLLQTVPGIGPGLAAKIVNWREEHGTLKSANDLARIPGIGEKRASTLAAHLAFGGSR